MNNAEQMSSIPSVTFEWNGGGLDTYSRVFNHLLILLNKLETFILNFVISLILVVLGL